MLEQERKDERATREVRVNFSDDAYKLLEAIAERTGKSVSEILRDALALEKLYDETVLENGRVLIERKDGSLREVVRP